MNSTDRVATVWEAPKIYIRGKIIPQTSKKKRERTDVIKKLEADLIRTERELAKHYSDSLFNDISKCKFKTHKVFNGKAECVLFRL